MLTTEVPKGTTITYDMVKVEKPSLIWHLRMIQDSIYECKTCSGSLPSKEENQKSQYPGIPPLDRTTHLNDSSLDSSRSLRWPMDSRE